MIEFDFPDYLPDEIQQELNRLMSLHIQLALKDIAKYIEDYAKRNHRYNDQTHKLSNSIKSSIKISDGLYSVDIYIDEGKAPYAKHIVDGHRSWAPDKFLDKALIENESYINQQIEIAISNAIQEFNQG
jgi:hypothetical protein